MRWGTALYRLKTSSTSVALILALMAEGVDVSALERVFGIREGTLRTWLTRAGLQAGKLHRHFFHHLILHHLQLDELWTPVRQGSQVVWIWAEVEAGSQLAPVLKLGPRSMDLANTVVRYHESLRVKLSQPLARKGKQTPRRYRRRIPAMAGGFTPHCWTVFELLSFPLPCSNSSR